MTEQDIIMVLQDGTESRIRDQGVVPDGEGKGHLGDGRPVELDASGRWVYRVI